MEGFVYTKAKPRKKTLSEHFISSVLLYRGDVITSDVNSVIEQLKRNKWRPILTQFSNEKMTFLSFYTEYDEPEKDQKVRLLAFKICESSLNYESPSAIPGEIFLTQNYVLVWVQY